MSLATAPAQSALKPRRVLLWLAVCGVQFYVGYGFANWAASRQGEVAAIRFAWEQGIPFLLWTIVPYWSIDLFYAACGDWLGLAYRCLFFVLISTPLWATVLALVILWERLR